MIPESRRAHRIVATADVRAAVALSKYRHARREWFLCAERAFGLRDVHFADARVARTRWSAYADLLREPLLAEVAA